MGDDVAEYELRCCAIRLRERGASFAQVLARLGRSRGWLAKWLRRFRESGWRGLKTQSRAPKRRPQSLPARVVAKVLALSRAQRPSQTAARSRSRFLYSQGQRSRSDLRQRQSLFRG
jgi:transposase